MHRQVGADGAAGRGPARHQPRRTGQAVAPTRAGRSRVGHPPRRRGQCAAAWNSAGLRYTIALPDARRSTSRPMPARLAQVIGNILNNAAKFTPRGGSVTLILERDGDDARHSHSRYWHRHRRGRPAARVRDVRADRRRRSKASSGLGIGLTLAKSLVERHDGQLTIESEGRGRGTEALVRLPALATRPPASRDDRAPPARRRQAGSRDACWSSTTITTPRR